MTLTSQVTCGSCGKSYRVHRRLARGSRYRFTCKRCGAVVTFGTSCVRWACGPGSIDARMSGRSTITRAPHDTLEAMAPPPVPLPPPIPSQDRPPPVNDTMMDGRPPVHLSPLVRRGVEASRESSRVCWLRQQWKTVASG